MNSKTNRLQFGHNFFTHSKLKLQEILTLIYSVCSRPKCGDKYEFEIQI